MQNLIEKDRLFSMVQNDNLNSPERVRVALSSEIQRVVRDYLELSEAIKVRFKQNEEEIVFLVEMHAKKLKPCGYMPRI